MERIQCPHYYSISCIHHGCLLGRFPVDCVNCNCPDKRIIEIKTLYNTTYSDWHDMTTEETRNEKRKVAVDLLRKIYVNDPQGMKALEDAEANGNWWVIYKSLEYVEIIIDELKRAIKWNQMTFIKVLSLLLLGCW